MSRPPGVACQIVYSKEFEAESQAIEPDYQRLDKMIDGAVWVIARSPLRGDVIVTLNAGVALGKLKVKATIEDDHATLTGFEADK